MPNSPHQIGLLDLIDEADRRIGRVRLRVAANGDNVVYSDELDAVQDIYRMMRRLLERTTGEYSPLCRTKADTTPDHEG